ncbi:MAG: hypoxanthine phosphoribosyltransferase [Ruminococcus sp.]
MDKDIKEILLSAEEITALTADIADKINKDYEGKNLVLLGLLKGSVCFMAELMKHIKIPCQIDFMSVSSYGNSTESTGRVNILKDMSISPEGKDILIVEDIIDSGNTLSFITQYLKSKRCNSVEIVTLLNKPARRQTEVYVKYSCKEIEDLFAVGFGLDYAEYYRNLPYIGVLKESVYTKETLN